MMPTIGAVSLSAGSRALAAKKVLVKRLVAIEDLGNIEILFTDKTGTLTEGVISFEQALDADGQPSERPLLFGLVCNEATVTEAGPIGGNALDQALWSAPGAAPGDDVALAAGSYIRTAVLPFDHERQLASVLVADPDGKPLLITKGAPEVILEWFVESIATQTLVVYVIRTRRIPFFKSRPSLPMLLVPTGTALVGATLPYTGLANLLGFTPLPTACFLILFGMVVVYLILVELAKTRFYRTPHPHTPRPPIHPHPTARKTHRPPGRPLHPPSDPVVRTASSP